MDEPDRAIHALLVLNDYRPNTDKHDHGPRRLDK